MVMFFNYKFVLVYLLYSFKINLKKIEEDIEEGRSTYHLLLIIIFILLLLYLGIVLRGEFQIRSENR